LPRLSSSSLPRSSARASSGMERDWRARPFEDESRAAGLEDFRGSAGGRKRDPRASRVNRRSLPQVIWCQS
jgi:hypothetical protein